MNEFSIWKAISLDYIEMFVDKLSRLTRIDFSIVENFVLNILIF